MVLSGWPASELRGRPRPCSTTARMLVPGMISAEQAKTRSAEQAAGNPIMRTDIRCLDPTGVARILERPGTDVEEKNWMLMMCEGEQPAVADSGEVAVDYLSTLAVSFLVTTPSLQRRSMLLRTPCGSPTSSFLRVPEAFVADVGSSFALLPKLMREPAAEREYLLGRAADGFYRPTACCAGRG